MNLLETGGHSDICTSFNENKVRPGTRKQRDLNTIGQTVVGLACLCENSCWGRSIKHVEVNFCTMCSLLLLFVVTGVFYYIAILRHRQHPTTTPSSRDPGNEEDEVEVEVEFEVEGEGEGEDEGRGRGRGDGIPESSPTGAQNRKWRVYNKVLIRKGQFTGGRRNQGI